MLGFVIFIIAIEAPVNKARDVLILLLHTSSAQLSLGSLVIVRLFKSLLFDTILDIKTIGTASLVTYKQLALTVIKAHASDVCVTYIAEHVLKATIRCVPDLNTSWMSRDEGVEDSIVEDAQAGIFIGQMMIDRLVVVVEYKTAPANNDSLRWLCNGQCIDFVQCAVKCLCG